MTDTSTAPTVDSTGVRTRITFIGVDSGTMAIGPAGAAPSDHDALDAALSGPLPVVRGGVAYATSGYGDGAYDLVAVTAPDDPTGGPDGIRAVEVVFTSPTIEAATDRWMAAYGPAAPTGDDYDEARTDPGGPAASRIDEHYRVLQAASTAAWDSHLADLDPASEATPHVLGTITVPADDEGAGPGLGVLAVGDPCHGAGVHVTVPAGTWTAVAWTDDGYTIRLGVYRDTP